MRRLANAICCALIWMGGTASAVADVIVPQSVPRATLKSVSQLAVSREGRLLVVSADIAYDMNHANGSNNVEARQQLAAEVISNLGDQYDFIVVAPATEVDLGSFAGLHWQVSNDVIGIGRPPLDLTEDFGSSGRLKAVIDLDDRILAPGVSYPGYDWLLDVLMHELMHQWGVYLDLRVGQAPGMPLATPSSHWSSRYDSDGSVMYGARWQPAAQGFRQAVVFDGYGPLDLYLGGFIAANELSQSTLVATDDLNGDELPELGRTVAGTAVPVDPAALLQALGPRQPAFPDTQREFTAALVVLERPNQPASLAMLDKLDRLRQQASMRFAAITRGRGRLNLGILAESVAPTPGNPRTVGPTSLPLGHLDLSLARDYLALRETDKAATRWQDTVRRALALGTAASVYPSQLQGLSAILAASSPVNSDEIGMLLRVPAMPPAKRAQLLADLRDRQREDGAFAFAEESSHTVLDTALGLRAMVAAREGLSAPDLDSAIERARDRLRDWHRSAENCWSLNPAGRCHFLTTVAAVQALADAGDADPHADGLFRWQRSDGGFGGEGASSAFETALALNALLAARAMVDTRSAVAEDYLRSAQRADGDWDGSVAATAEAVLFFAQRSLPDLLVSGAPSATPMNPVRGQLVEYRARIRNAGAEDAPASRYALSARPADGLPVSLGSGDLPPLGAGATTGLAIDVDTQALQVGHHVLVLDLDSDGTIAESQESNNSAELAIDVTTPPVLPDLSIQQGRISLNPNVVSTVPQRLDVAFTVENTGTTATSGVLIRVAGWRFGELRTLATTRRDIGALARVPMTVSTEINDLDISRIVVELDADQAIVEAREDNNSAEAMIDREPTVDLEVLAADLVFESPPTQATPGTFTLLARNIGTRESPVTRLRVVVESPDGNSLILVDQEVQVAAGSQIMRRVTFTPALAGTHRLRVQVDPDNSVVEIREDNNAYDSPFEVMVSTRPNLRIDPGTWHVQPDPGLQGAAALVQVRVLNPSAHAAPMSAVELSAAPAGTGQFQLVGRATVPPLDPGAQADVAIAWHEVELAGSLDLRAVADVDQTVEESDETDNEALRTFVSIGLPNVQLTAVDTRVVPSAVPPGTAARVLTTVRNTGGQAVPAVDIELLAGDTPLAPVQTISDLAPGSTRTLEFDFIRPADGSVVRLQADRGEVIRESQEDDNIVTLNLELVDPDFYATEPYFSPNGDGVADSTSIVARLTPAIAARLRVISSWGAEVARYEAPGVVSEMQWRWDGLRGDGTRALDDRYDVLLEDQSGEELARLQIVLDTNRAPLVLAARDGHARLRPVSCELSTWPSPVPTYWDEIPGSASFPGTDFAVVVSTRMQGAVTTEGLFRVDADGSEPRLLLASSEVAPSTGAWHVWMESADAVMVAISAGNGIQLRRLDPVDGSALAPPMMVVGAQRYLGKLEDGHLVFLGAPGLMAVAPGGQTSVLAGPSDFDGGVLPVVGRERVMVKRPGSAWDFRLLGLSGTIDAPTTLVPVEYQNPARFAYGYSAVARAFFWATGATPVYVRAPVPERLLRIDERDGQITTLAEWDRGLANYSFGISPSGKHMLAVEGGGARGWLYDFERSTVLPLDLAQQLPVAVPLNPDFPVGRVLGDLLWSPDEDNVATSLGLYQDVDSSIARLPEPVLGLMAQRGFLLSAEDGTLHDTGESLAQAWIDGERQWLGSQDGVALERAFDRSVWVPGDIDPGTVQALPMATDGRFAWVRRYVSDGECAGDRVEVLSSTANGFAQLAVEYEAALRSLLVRATAEDLHLARFSVSFQRVGSEERSEIFSGNSTLDDEVLGVWSPPGPGRYRLRLRVLDRAGNAVDSEREVVWFEQETLGLVRSDLRLFSPNADGVKDAVTVSYELRGPANIALRVADANGLTVRTLDRVHSSAGSYAWTWDGRRDNGEMVPDGRYRVSVNDRAIAVTLDTQLPELFWRQAERNSQQCLPDVPTATPVEFAGRDDHPEVLRLETRPQGSAHWRIARLARGSLPTESLRYEPGVLAVDAVHRHALRLVGEDGAGNRSTLTLDRLPLWPLAARLSRASVIFDPWVRGTRASYRSGQVPSTLWLEVLARDLQGWMLQRLSGGQWVGAAFDMVAPADTGPELDQSCAGALGRFVRIDLPWLDPVQGATLRFVHADGRVSPEFSIASRVSLGSGGGAGQCQLSGIPYCEAVGVSSARIEKCPGDPPTSVRWRDPRTGSLLALPILAQTHHRATLDLSSLPVGGEYQLEVETLSGNPYEAWVGRWGGVVPPPIVDRPLDGDRICGSGLGAIVGEVRSPFVDAVSGRTELRDGAGRSVGEGQTGLRVDRLTRPGGGTSVLNANPLAFAMDVGAPHDGPAELFIEAGFCGVSSALVRRSVTVDGAVQMSDVSYGRSDLPGQAPAQMTLGVKSTPMVFSPALGHSMQVNVEAFEALTISARVRAIAERPPLNAWTVAGPVLEELPTHQTRGGVVTWSWDGRIAGSIAADRDYGVELIARDHCGNEKSVIIPVAIDSTAPTIDWMLPEAFQPVAVFQELKAQIADLWLMDVRFAFLAPGASAWSEIANFEVPPTRRLDFTARAQWHSAVPAGTYRLSIEARDQARNVTRLEREITVPQRVPMVVQAATNLSLISPNGDGIVDTVQLGWQQSRTGLVSLAVLDAAGVTLRTLLADVVVNGSQTRSWDGRNDSGQVVADGSYEIRLQVRDPSPPGDVEVALFPIIVDTTAPVVERITPMGIHSNGRGLLTIRLIEDHPRVLTASAVPPIPGLLGQHAGAGLIDLATLDEVPEGSYRISLAAEDQGGNRSNESFDVLIDRTAPVVELSLPEPGSVLTRLRGPVTIAGSVEDPRLSEWRLELSNSGGVIASADPASSGPLQVVWDALVPDGSYQLRLHAADAAGNQAMVERPIVVDNTAPVAQIATPPEHGHVGAVIDVNGTATDANLTRFQLAIAARPGGTFTVLAEGDSAVVDGLLSSLPAPPADGEYVLRLQVTDAAGTMSEDFVDIIVDTAPPPAPTGLLAQREGLRAARLTILAPSHPDVVAYRILRQGVAIGQTSTTEFLDPDLPDGVYRYRVEAIDRAGNASPPSSEATVRIDTTPPEVLLARPAPGARVGGRIDVHGRAYSRDDFADYELLAQVLQPPGAAEPVMARQSPVLGGSLGVWDSRHLLTAPVRLLLRARDLSGNVATAELDIVVDNEAPAAPVGLAAVEIGADDVALSWQANTESDLLGYLLYRDSRLLNGSPEQDLRLIAHVDTEWLDAGVGDGSFAWRVAAIDTTGNVSAFSAPVMLTRSGRPPRVVLVRPGDGTRFDGDVAVRGQAGDLDLAEVQFEAMAEPTGSWAGFGPLFEQPPFDSRFVPTPRAYGFYRLRARSTDSEGLSDPSPPEIRVEHRDLTAPPRPQSLSLSVDGDRVSLAWTAVDAEDLAGYRVERASAGGAFLAVTTASASANTALDLGVADGSHRYRVLAIDSSDNASTPSPVATALVHVPVLTQPYAPTLEEMTQLEIRSVLAGSLAIEHASAAGTTTLPAVTMTSGVPLALELPLEPGENVFSFRLTDAQGNRSRTASVEVLRSQAPPMPTDLQASVNAYQVDLQWIVAPHPYPWGFRVMRGGLPVVADAVRAPETAFLALGNGDSVAAPQLVDNDTGSGLPLPEAQRAQIDLRLSESALVTAIELVYADTIPDGVVRATARWRQVDVPLRTSPESDQNVARLVLPTAYRSNRFGVVLEPAVAATLVEVRVLTRTVQTPSSWSESLPDGRHRYRVQTVNEHGFQSASSDPLDVDVGDATPPDAPVLSGTVTGSDAVLSWTIQASPDLAAFWVMRGSSRIATLSAEARSHVDAGLLNGAYGYRVYAVDAVGNHASSNLLVLEVDVGQLTAPAALTASAVTGGGAIDLAWQPGSGSVPTGYRIARSLQEAGPFVALADVAGTSHRDSGLSNGTRYHYRVRARDGVGNLSPESNTASAIPFSDAPVVTPLFVHPTRHGRSVTVLENESVISGRGQAASVVEVGHAGFVTTTEVLAATDQRVIGVGVLAPDARHLWVNDFLRRASDGSSIGLVPSHCAVQWPDAHQLLVCESDGGSDRLTRITLPGLVRSELLSLPQLSAFQLASDGRRVVVIGDIDGSGTSVLAWRDGASAAWQAIAPAAAIDADSLRIDPGSRWLLWSRNGVFERFDFQTGQLLGLPVSGVVGRPAFSRRSAFVLMIGEAGGVPGLHRVDLSSGVHTLIPLPRTGLEGIDLNSDDSVLGVADSAGVHFYRWPDLSPLESLNLPDIGDLRALPTDEWLAGRSDDQIVVQRPGTFRVAAMPLAFGDNVIAAIASAPGQLDSSPALPITVTVPADGLPDLAVRASDLSVQPAAAAPGTRVRVGIRVRNLGSAASTATTVRVLLAAPDGSAFPVQSVALPAMASGGMRVVQLDTPVLDAPGIHVLNVLVNPDGLPAESSRANNTASRTLVVSADGAPELLLNADRTRIGPSESLTGSTILSAAGASFSGRLRLAVFDDRDHLVVALRDDGVMLAPGAAIEESYTWIPGSIAAGPYVLRAILTGDDGRIVRQRELPVALDPVREFSLSLSPSQQSVAIGSPIAATARVQYRLGNVIVEGAELRTQLLTAAGQVVATRSDVLPSMTAGFDGSLAFDFPSATLAPGAYQLISEVWAGARLAEGGAAATVLPPAGSVALSGTWLLPQAPLLAGSAIDLPLELRNTGGSPLESVPLRITARRQLQSQPVATLETTVDLLPGAARQLSLAVPAVAMDVGVLILVIEVSAGTLRGVLDVRSAPVLDGLPPQLTVLSPTPGRIVPSAVDVSVRAIDAHSPIDRVELRSGAGAYLPMSAAVEGAGIYRRYLSALGDGPLTLAARATDAYGNVAVSAPWTVVVDGTPPVIAIDGVVDGQAYVVPVTPTISVTDAHPATTHVLLNGEPYASGTPIDGDGRYSLAVVATDQAGNRSQRGLVFDIDRSAPGVAFVFPLDNAVINAADTEVRVQTEAGATVQLTAGAQSLQAVSAAGGITLFPRVALVEGSNLLRAVAVDRAGNASLPAEITVTRSTATLGLISGEIQTSAALMEPGPDLAGLAILRSTAGGALDDVSTRLSLQSAAGATLAQRQWVLGFPPGAALSQPFDFATAGLSLGSTTLVLEAQLRDGSGALLWVVLAQHPVVFADLTPPTVNLVVPASDALLQPVFEARASVVDGLSAVETVALVLDQGSPQAMEGPGPEYLLGVQGLADGPHSAVVQASDAAGNANVQPVPARSFRVDGTPPVIQISGVSDGQLSAVALSPIVSVEDANPGSQSITLNGQTFASGTSVAADGHYLLRVDAVDAAGNSAERELRFVIDTTPPPLQITAPIDGIATASTRIAVEALTEATIDVSLLGVNPPHVLRSDEHGQVRFEAVWLVPGENRIALQAVDRAGNASAPVEVRVYRLIPATAPVEVEFLLPPALVHGEVLTGAVRVTSTQDPGAVADELRLEVVDGSGAGIASLEWSRMLPLGQPEDLEVVLPTSTLPAGELGLRLQWRRPLVPETPYTIVAARSLALIDQVPPVVEIVEPAIGAVVQSPLTITVRAEDAPSGIASVAARIGTGDWLPMAPLAVPHQWQLITPLPGSGTHLVSVRAEDDAGNVREVGPVPVCVAGVWDRFADGFEATTPAQGFEQTTVCPEVPDFLKGWLERLARARGLGVSP